MDGLGVLIDLPVLSFAPCAWTCRFNLALLCLSLACLSFAFPFVPFQCPPRYLLSHSTSRTCIISLTASSSSSVQSKLSLVCCLRLSGDASAVDRIARRPLAKARPYLYAIYTDLPLHPTSPHPYTGSCNSGPSPRRVAPGGRLA